jgi:hypothetical protein
VTQYTKLGILLVRIFGMLMVLYAIPMVIVSVLAAIAAGEAGTESSYQSLVLWLAYGVAGAAAYFLAVPIARRAACDIEEHSTDNPQPNKR